MQEYVSETEESLSEKIARAEKLIEEESNKLHEKEMIAYEFDHYSGEVRMVFVKQTTFLGGWLTHGMLMPLRQRVKEVDKKWHVGIMVYGGKRRGKDEAKVS